MRERIVFSSALATRIRAGAPHFESSDERFRDELEKKYQQTGGTISAARVHPDIVHFCSRYWDEAARRLQFETQRPYDECSREVARRHPFVYFCRAEVGEWNEYDIDLPRTIREED